MGALDRPVAGVVHAWCHLVAEQFAVLDEQLQCEHADVVEPLGQRARQRGGTRLQRADVRRRCQTQAEHAVDMPVAGQRPAAEFAIASAHRQHRQLALERHERFQDQPVRRRLRAQCRPRGIRIGGLPQAELALAVVAEPARLQDRRCADLTQRAIEIVAAVHRHELRRRQAALAEQGLLGQPVLRHRERPRIRKHRGAPGHPAGGFGRHVLEVEGDHVDLGGERLQRGVVAPVGDPQRGDLTGTGVGGAVDHAHLHAQRCRRQRQHARQLTTAQNTQHRLASGAH